MQIDFLSRFAKLEQIGVVLAPPDFWKLPKEIIDAYG